MSRPRLDPGSAVPLGGQLTSVTEITVYPQAAVLVRKGGEGIGDASHHLAIVLPSLGKEIRIPVNQQWLGRFARQLTQATSPNGGQHE